MKYMMLLALLVSCSVQAIDVKKMKQRFSNPDDNNSYKPAKSVKSAAKAAPVRPSVKPVNNKKYDDVEVVHDAKKRAHDDDSHDDFDNKKPKGAPYKEIKDQSEKRIKKLESRIADLKRNLDPKVNSDFRYFGAHLHSSGKAYLNAITAELPKVKAVLKKFQNELAKAKMLGYATFTAKELADMRAEDRKQYDQEYAFYKKAIQDATNNTNKNNQ